MGDGDSPLMERSSDVSSSVTDSNAVSNITGGDEEGQQVAPFNNPVPVATGACDTTDGDINAECNVDEVPVESCAEGAITIDCQLAVTASDKVVADGTESDVLDRPRVPSSLDEPGGKQPDATAKQDSQSLLDLSSPRGSLDDNGTSNTQGGSVEETRSRLVASVVSESKVASPADEGCAIATTLSMQQTLSGCLSDDSGIIDPRPATESVSASQNGNEVTSPQSPEKKKKGFFGKLKKKLIHKEGSPGKGVTSPVSINDDSSPRMRERSLQVDMEASPSMPDLGPTTTISDQLPMHPIEHRNNCTSPSLDFQTMGIQNEPACSMVAEPAQDSRLYEASPRSERVPHVEDSVLVTPASQVSSNPGPISEISIISDLADPSPLISQRRLSVQASHEVAHVFRPPRPSSAHSTPVHSRATSPHTSQSRSPESGQLSFASSGQFQTQQRAIMQMRPHLPALVGPRESFSLPPNPRKESATRTMTRLIRKDLWSHDSVQVESALLHLADVASDPDKVALIARTGGLLAIVNCMEQHTLHAGIQVAACNALEKLALDSENELAIGEVGGVEAIQGAMMTHFGDTRVQEAAWSALWNLSCGNADCSSLNHGGLVCCR